MAPSDRLRDSAIKHAVDLRRYGGSLARDIDKLLDAAEHDLVGLLEARLTGIITRGRDLGPRSTARLQEMLEAIRQQRSGLADALRDALESEMIELADVEATEVIESLNDALGVDLGNLRPDPETLRALVTEQPLAGRLLREWTADIPFDAINKINAAIRLGVAEAQTDAQIIRRVRDAHGMTRRKATALVRTSVGHISASAREATFSANDDLIDSVQWLSTLDTRTTPICMARDHKTFPINSGPRPPAHPNCRSTTTPILGSWASISGALDPRRPAGLADKISPSTRSAMRGQVPQEWTYGDWLKNQTHELQDEILGVTRAKLFRDGRLRVDQFVDLDTGRRFTLAELARRRRTTTNA